MEINDSNFQSVLDQGKPVVLDFWATWCGPCRMIAPFVEELANQYEGQVIIGKVNVEECDELTEKFAVRNIPTLFFIKNGKDLGQKEFHSFRLIIKKQITYQCFKAGCTPVILRGGILCH